MKRSIDNDKFKDLRWTYKDIQKSNRLKLKYENKQRRELIKLDKRRYKKSIRRIKDNVKLSSRLDKFTTTKLFMYIILINCIAVEVYSMWVMYVLKDLTALYSLIGAVITQSVSFAIYCVKSHNDTKEEVASQLERDKFNAELMDIPQNIIEEPPTQQPEDDYSGE